MHCATDYLLPETHVKLSRKMTDIKSQKRIWKMCTPWYNRPKNSTPPPTYFLVTKLVFVADETALTNLNITTVFSVCSNNTYANNPSHTTNNYSVHLNGSNSLTETHKRLLSFLQ